MDLGYWLPLLLGIAWLLPLASFTIIVLFGPRLGKHGVGAAYLATFAIVFGFLCSLVSLGLWLNAHPLSPELAAAEEHTIDLAREHGAGASHHGADAKVPDYFSGNL